MGSLSRLIPVQSKREREILLPCLPISLCTECLRTEGLNLALVVMWPWPLTATRLQTMVKNEGPSSAQLLWLYSALQLQA